MQGYGIKLKIKLQFKLTIFDNIHVVRLKKLNRFQAINDKGYCKHAG